METHRLVLDSGALSSLADGDEALRSVIQKAIRQGIAIVVPSAVVAESVTGTARDANVNRTLKAVPILALGDRLARAAGALRHAAGMGRGAVVDAIVVASADDMAGSLVLTGDARDLGRLAAVRDRTRVVGI